MAAGTGFEQALSGLTVAAVLTAVGLPSHEWRQSRQAGRDDGARRTNAPGSVVEHRGVSSRTYSGAFVTARQGRS